MGIDQGLGPALGPRLCIIDSAGQELNGEFECGPRGDVGGRAPSTIRHVMRNFQLASAPNLHALKPSVPALEV